MFFVLMGIQMLAQDRTVTGRVTASDDGSGIPGASISIKGTAKGTSSDADGNYKITVSGSSVLTFSSVGFNSQDVSVGNKSQINVALATDTKALTEVVVVGYGTQKKSQLTGAISSVTSKQITEMPITNLGQAMQGRVAGVDVAQSGSKPGTVPKVLIRGRRSFNAGNDPLYVVDGIPLSSGYEDMNPNDVASMEILKDATATAIYGARGANGVVLITTKRGSKDGKTVISYDTYVGSTQTLDKINLFTGAEYAEMKRESRRTIGTYKDANGNLVPTGVMDAYADSKLFTAIELDGIAKGRTTDYQDLMVRKGFQQNHAIGVQGGNEKTQFSINGGYFQDKGIIEGLDFTRYSLRVNVDHQVNKALKVGISSYGMYGVTNGANLNPYGFLLSQNPLARAFDDSGNLIFQQTDDALLTNPLNEIVKGAKIDETRKYRIFNSVYAELQLAKGLKYRVNFGPDFTISRNGQFNGALTNAIKGGNPTATTDNRFGFNYTIENILTYNKQIKDHNIGITALQSMQRDNYEQFTQSVLGVPVETQAFFNLGNASSIQGIGSNLIQWTIASYMARINYDYKGKYLLTVTARRDGSSRFGENTKWGNFPGVALGWNLHQENFMKRLTFIDELKLRASMAQVGNQGLSPYQTQGLEGRTSYAWNNNAAYGYRPNTIGNADLKWETSTSKNIGADFSLWRGKVSGSVEYYQTNTTDLLLSDQLPTSTGFAAVTRNVGETKNTGIELSLSTVNVDAENGFKWSTDFTFYKNTEEIVSLYNGAKDDVGNRWFIGKPLNSYYDYKYEGIWQTAEAADAKAKGFSVGQIKVADSNGDGKITADDRVLLGSDVPTWTGGITNRFSYKGFDLSFFIFTRQGQKIVSRFHQNSNYLQGRYNQIKVDYWTPNNPNAYYPRPNFNQEFPAYNTAIMYFDGSFIKVRNINVGYTFPAKTAQKLGLSSLRVYASIQQPFIFSKYRSKENGVDPETSNGNVDNNVTPATQVSTFGLNIKF
ncbi:SusC/RagA family TonB-linked outer membrane protein [Aquirufa regiilacus]|uniref:TonB-dependent receptor n=1 Tax=Aquirufa regiilacus TaxID=3024868 RepID=A0ABU3TQV3_9BACT|nr:MULTISPECIES: TonB-dependent receptor [unclassified Aquirufa]MDT8886779.1 TonB-dependent receptor [Aquirufa sp. LEPPI-3A]MDU0808256.1 TonB-dependent receptor [Aquirufa sp. LEOWEIH-7C]